MDAWSEVTWRHLEEVRAALDAGADVNARIGGTQATPLYRALQEATPQVVELLLARGADVEATAQDWTPLWAAVRGAQLRAVDRPEWRREKVQLLLRAGADPWRPTVGGRSPGEVALWGPLADLFIDLPGAPQISQTERERQAQADALIASYAWADQWGVGGCSIAFVKGVPADEVIRRLGANPTGNPRVGREELWSMAQDVAPTFDPSGPQLLWLDDVAGGTVAVDWAHYLLTVPEIAALVSRGGVLASTFAGAHGVVTVHVAQDGQYLRWTEPIYGPGSTWGGRGEPFEEERWCRFGDLDAPAGSLAQCLALMTMLTGIRVGETWLMETPKRAVVVSPPRPAL